MRYRVMKIQHLGKTRNNLKQNNDTFLFVQNKHQIIWTGDES